MSLHDRRVTVVFADPSIANPVAPPGSIRLYLWTNIAANNIWMTVFTSKGADAARKIAALLGVTCNTWCKYSKFID